MKIVQKYWPLILYLFILFIATRNFLFKEGYLLYGEYLSSIDYLSNLKQFLKAWSDETSLGHSNIGFPTTYGLNPVYFISSPGFVTLTLLFKSSLQLLFASFTSKIYLLTAMTLVFFGMYHFVKVWLKQSKEISFLSGLIYLTSAQIIDRVYAGHVGYIFGYGFLPLLLLFIFKSSEDKNKKIQNLNLLSAGFVSSLLLRYMPHLFTFIALMLFFYFTIFILFSGINKLKRFLFICFIFILLTLFLNINAWLPAVFYPEKYPFLKNLTYSFQSVYYSSQRANLKAILGLESGFQEKIYASDFFNSLRSFRYVFPVLSFLALIFLKERKKTLFAFLLIITGLILSLGVKSPVGNLFTFIYKNTPFFSPFRDISKFVVLYAFGIAMLFPISLTYLQKINRKIYSLTFAFLIGFILIINPLFLSGNFDGSIIPFQIPSKYRQLKKFLQKEVGNYRVAIYPNNSNIGDYDWYKKIGIAHGSPYFNIFTSLLPIEKNIAISNRTLRDYGSRYLDYLESNLDEDWAVKRLADLNIRFIIIDHSLPGSDNLSVIADKNKSLKRLPTVSGFSLFEIINSPKQYLNLKSPIYFFGDMNGLQYIPNDYILVDLGFNPLSVLSQNLSNTLFLHNKSIYDLFLHSLNDYQLSFFPEAQNNIAEFLPSADNIRDLSFQGINTYNPEGIFASSVSSITKRLNLKPGNYRLFLNLLTGENEAFTNTVGLQIGNSYLEKKGFKKNLNTFLWLDFGLIKIMSQNDLLTLKNLENKYLILDSLVIIPEKEYSQKLSQFEKALKTKLVVNLDENLRFADLDLKTNPIFVYSKNYSPYWNICDSTTFMVNFSIIGSKCAKDFKPNPIFQPTDLYNISLCLSLLFNSVIIFFILKLNLINRRDKTH